AAYRRDGPLAVTDTNVMVGTLQADFFPKIFGPASNEPLDVEEVSRHYREHADRLGDRRSPEELPGGFLKVAVENMANAIKKISVARGYDITRYCLNSFGGAGGQHACAVADSLGMTTVLIHPLSGILSAYGMGLADIRANRSQAVAKRLDSALIPEIRALAERLGAETVAEVAGQGVEAAQIMTHPRAHLRYEGT